MEVKIMGAKCCGKAAEGHSCGCGTKRADTATVQEPDWIPDGDGRAIGQQDLAINLSPLHAEHEQGYDDRDDEAIGEKHRGRHSQDMKARRDESKGMTDSLNPHHPYSDVSTMSANTVGSPSPTFNENITGQDGPSDSPTNATFEAMRVLAPTTEDWKAAREAIRKHDWGEVIHDDYLVYRDGTSNKFYYVAVTERDGQYYPIAVWDRIGYFAKKLREGKEAGRMRNLAGGKDQMTSRGLPSKSAAYNMGQAIVKKKEKKGYEPYTLHNAEHTLAQIEGPTAEATSGGLHAPSSFTMTWEDGMGTSSPSMPPNEIAWAENVQEAEDKVLGMGLMDWGIAAVTLFVAGKAVEWGLNRNKGNKVTKEAKGCGCAGKRVVKSETVEKHSEYSVGHINPVEVEGQNDIRNAESIRLPTPHAGPQSTHRQGNRPSLKMW